MRTRFVEKRVLVGICLAATLLIALACGPGEAEPAAPVAPTQAALPAVATPTQTAAQPAAPAPATPVARPLPTVPATAVPAPAPQPTPSRPIVETQPKSTKIILLWADDPAETLPWGAPSGTTDELKANIYDRLFWLDANLAPTNRMVESWEYVNDKTLDFKLIEGIVAHDGSPFTSDDVVWVYDQFMRSPDSLAKGTLGGFFGPDSYMEAVDDTNIRFFMEKANVAFRNSLGMFTSFVSRDAYERLGVDEFRLNPVGTGPYRFVEHRPKQRWILERHEDYYGERPPIETVEWIIAPEYTTRLALLETGAADVMDNVAPTDIEKLDRVVASPAIPQNFVMLQVNNPIFADQRVRQAMNYAVDKEAIIGAILGGLGGVSRGGDSSAMAPTHPSLQPYLYDPDKARSLLADAGYANGFEFEIVGAVTGLDKERIEAVQGYLADIGVTARLNVMEFGLMWPKVLKGEWEDSVAMGCSNSAVERIFCTTLWFHPEGRGKLYAQSPESWGTQLDAINSETDQDRRGELIWALEEAVFEYAPWIFLTENPGIFGLSDRVDRFEMHTPGWREVRLMSMK